MTRTEYDRYRIFHRVRDNVIEIYDFKECKYTDKYSIPVPSLEWFARSCPYLGHIIEWLVNFQPN